MSPSPWARASELERLLLCPGSAPGLLPRDDRRSEYVRDAGDWGTMVHRWKATGEVVAQPGRPSHERLLRERIAVSGIDRGAVWPSWEHEVGCAVDCASDATAIFSGTPEEIDAWKAECPESWVTGTCDGWGMARAVNGEGLIVVDDLKTGRQPPEPGCDQMLLYATALLDWVARGLHRRGHALLRITHWPRYPRDGRPEFHTHGVGPADIAAFRARLREGYATYLLARDSYVPGVAPSLLPVLDTGDHCNYCDSRSACPAWVPPSNEETE